MWKQKLDADGKPVVKDGLPIFIKDDGTETTFDAESQFKTVGRLMGESREHREARETAEGKLKAFEGLDVTEAKKAIETVKSFDGKQVIAAGELERSRLEAANVVEAKYKPVLEKVSVLESQLQNVTIGNQFANSKFIAEKIAEHVPRDMLQATFGQNFKMVDGKLTATLNGNPIYSPSNPAELAKFDEALEVMIGSYSNKSQILKGTGAGGSGSGGGSGGGSSGGKPVMTRAAFEALGPAERMTAVKDNHISD